MINKHDRYNLLDKNIEILKTLIENPEKYRNLQELEEAKKILGSSLDFVCNISRFLEYVEYYSRSEINRNEICKWNIEKTVEGTVYSEIIAESLHETGFPKILLPDNLYAKINYDSSYFEYFNSYFIKTSFIHSPYHDSKILGYECVSTKNENNKIKRKGVIHHSQGRLNSRDCKGIIHH